MHPTSYPQPTRKCRWFSLKYPDTEHFIIIYHLPDSCNCHSSGTSCVTSAWPCSLVPTQHHKTIPVQPRWGRGAPQICTLRCPPAPGRKLSRPHVIPTLCLLHSVCSSTVISLPFPPCHSFLSGPLTSSHTCLECLPQTLLWLQNYRK